MEQLQPFCIHPIIMKNKIVKDDKTLSLSRV